MSREKKIGANSKDSEIGFGDRLKVERQIKDCSQPIFFTLQLFRKAKMADFIDLQNGWYNGFLQGMGQSQDSF